MSYPELDYDDDIGCYVDEDGGTYYDSEGRESADGDD